MTSAGISRTGRLLALLAVLFLSRDAAAQDGGILVDGARGTLEEPVTVEGAPVTGLEIRLGEAAVIRGRILGIEPWERVQKVWATKALRAQ